MALSISGNEETHVAERAPLGRPRHSLADQAMDRYAMGDARAFETVFDEIAPELERFFDSRVGPARGSQLIEDTLLTIHRMRGTFIRGSAVLPWALAIAEKLIEGVR